MRFKKKAIKKEREFRFKKATQKIMLMLYYKITIALNLNNKFNKKFNLGQHSKKLEVKLRDVIKLVNLSCRIKLSIKI